jgi:hypothetical protein
MGRFNQTDGLGYCREYFPKEATAEEIIEYGECYNDKCNMSPEVIVDIPGKPDFTACAECVTIDLFPSEIEVIERELFGRDMNGDIEYDIDISDDCRLVGIRGRGIDVAGLNEIEFFVKLERLLDIKSSN